MNFLTLDPLGPKGTSFRLKTQIDGRDCVIEVKTRKGVKRLTLRINPKTGNAHVSAPPGTKESVILDFVTRQSSWVKKQQASLPRPLSIQDGHPIPFRGEETRLRLTGRPPRTVFYADGIIVIGGPVELAAARLQAFLKKEARARLLDRVQYYEEILGVTHFSVSIRDTVSRWGSCSSRGRLNFSWRLILAPDAVLDYVAAHEVCHLREMNHSPRFWQLVASLDPNWGDSRAWLRSKGHDLLSLRFES